MAKRDYYEMLGVNRDADEEAIKNAYRRLAMKHHPDRNPDNPKAEELFKEAKEAYETLTDANKRAAYDRYGHAGVDPRAGMAGGGAAGFSGFADAFGDIFGDIFNQARGQDASRRRRRRSHSPVGRGRAGGQWRTGGRSLRADPGQAPSRFSA